MADDPEPDPAPSAIGSNRRSPRPALKRSHRQQPLRIGRALGTSLSIWVRHCPVFLLLSALVFVPYALYLRWIHSDPGDAELLVHLQDPFARISQMIVAAPVISTVISEPRGRRDSFGRSLSTGLRSFPSVIGVALVTALLFILCAAPMLTAALVESETGMVVLVFPTAVVMVILSLLFFVAVPVAVVERPGVFAALKRSIQLTKGRRFSIFLILLIFAVVTIVLMGVFMSTILRTAIDRDLRLRLPEWSWIVQAAIPAFLASIEAVVDAVV